MPVKFEIYRDGSRLANYAPVSAMAMGPESVPNTGDVTFKDGLLIVSRADDNHAVGVSLLWDAGAQGAYQLETTRVMPRDKPYVLNVELARFRLMKIVQKQEDWNLFDFPRADKYTVRFREAQNLFAEALGKLDEPAEAANLADDAMAIALELSEQLAAFHGELLINRRRASNTFVKHIFGTRVDSSVQNAKYRDAVSTHFDYAVVPMSWKQLQPEEGVFKTDALDEWVETLNRKRVPIIAGPLIDLNEGQVPDWLFIWEHDFDTLRELAYEFVQKVVHRYRKAVAVWNVASGFHTNRALTLSFEQIIELTRLLVAHVKNMLPQARTLITITHPFGEYHARATTSVPPMLYAEMVAQSGINFEAFGLEMEMGVPAPGKYLRDVFQVSTMLDKFATLGRPLFLTAIGAPGRATADPTDSSEGRLDPAQGGRWRRPWDPQVQAEWMEAVYRAALSKPFVESVAWSNLADIGQTLPGGGLFDEMLQPKPVFTRLQKLRDQFHQWDGPKGLGRLIFDLSGKTAMREPGAWLWTTRQRRVLAAVVIIVAGALLARAYFQPTFVADPVEPAGPRAAELASRIDPNTADWPAWAALPLIGEKRARQIVEFREQWRTDHPGETPFAKIEDLTRVKGIGKATIAALDPFLAFPPAAAEVEAPP